MYIPTNQTQQNFSMLQRVINKLKSIWTKRVAYISQSPFFLDDSIKNNIAFAIDTKKIDNNNLKQKIIKIDSKKSNKIYNQIKNEYFLSSGNKENLSFVLKILKIFKLNNKILLKTLNKFKGLKYRQQIIFKNKNLTIINDSKSTSFASSENLLKNLNYVYWILGGIPKKSDQFKLSKKLRAASFN